MDKRGKKLGSDDREEAAVGHRRWQHIWIRTIAEAWADPDFEKELYRDARAAIEKRFKAENYKIPDGLKLTVSPVRGKVKETGEYAFEDMPATEMTMYLPPRPDLEDQAVALADYADAGRTYPFTTC